MNLRVHGLRLAKRLADKDETRNCHFCNKKEWGEEHHDKDCPFSIAYRMIKFEKQSIKSSTK